MGWHPQNIPTQGFGVFSVLFLLPEIWRRGSISRMLPAMSDGARFAPGVQPRCAALTSR